MSSQRGNEAVIGAALSEIFSDWLVNRPDAWITGKVWPKGEACPTPAHVRSQVSTTLAALKVDYLDLCLLPAHSNAAAFKVSHQLMQKIAFLVSSSRTLPSLWSKVQHLLLLLAKC